MLYDSGGQYPYSTVYFYYAVVTVPTDAAVVIPAISRYLLTLPPMAGSKYTCCHPQELPKPKQSRHKWSDSADNRVFICQSGNGRTAFAREEGAFPGINVRCQAFNL